MAKKKFNIIPEEERGKGSKKKKPIIKIPDKKSTGSQTTKQTQKLQEDNPQREKKSASKKTENKKKIQREKTNPNRKGPGIAWWGLTLLAVIAAAWGWYEASQKQGPKVKAIAQSNIVEGNGSVCKTNCRYGYELSDFHLRGAVIREGVDLRQTLTVIGIPPAIINAMNKTSEDGKYFSWDIPKMGDNVLVLAEKEDPDKLKHVIVELGFPRYALFHIEEEIAIEILAGKVDTLLETASGIVRNQHLWESVLNNTCKYEVLKKMEDALKWAVDFYHVETGDEYKILYERYVSVDGRNQIGRLLGVWFHQWNKEHYAFYFRGGGERGYFDEKGRPARRAFLKSPIKYGRITSPFGVRFHPVDKVEKWHLGTDYAAPEGTEILAVADGDVLIADGIDDSNNGKYVKIQHPYGYQSQYLHMVNLADGLRRGSKVKQGQVIGYVGSTGKATGPHVCFRFWKKNKRTGQYAQINHLEEDLPSSKPIRNRDVIGYNQNVDTLKTYLDKIQVF